jgi:hypothetical protein
MSKIKANTEARWEFINLDNTACKFVVYDNFMKKHREFYVPFLYDVRIDGDIAIVMTKHSKVMELHMTTATRKFL